MLDHQDMSIDRVVYLNPVEPQPMSLRAATGLPTVVNIYFRNNDDTPYGIDVAAQLQIMPRSSGPAQAFSVPATNRPQGLAQFLIPADTLNDPNGYRMRMVGTFEGAPILIAVGDITPIEAPGIKSLPEDVIDQITITIERGGDFLLYIRLWQDAAKTIPMDMTDASVTAAIELSQTDGTLIANFAVALGTDPASYVLTLAQAIVDVLPGACWWRMRLTKTATGTTTLAEGSVTVVDAI
jgi:hypothetical protein